MNLFIYIADAQQQQQQYQQQYQTQSSDSGDANRALPNAFQQTQMPTSHLVPSQYGDQQVKTSVFGPPPTSYPGMPSLPNAGATRFPTTFPPATLPNANAQSAFNSTSAPPLPSNAGQASTFIGQQQQQQPQQQTPLMPPPQQGGFYGQQQALHQQPRPGLPAFNATNNPNNAFLQQQQQQQPPPSSSSPATINPSYVQPSAMPTPPPLASQQPYGGYGSQPNFYNPVQH